MSSKQPGGIKLFYSYAHADDKLRDELEKQLKILKRTGVIESWCDRNITAGADWKSAIDDNLGSADIILLLISSDFISSDYCYEYEMTQAMGKHESGEAVVIPVILRPVNWRGAPFRQLQALPKDGVPVTSWLPNMDAAFANISEGIEKVATELLTKRKERGDSTPQPAVYLAETDDGQMRPYRERIVKQLEAQGCRILPPPEEDDPLPDESPDYENKVREYLEEARLSVHLVGGRYGRSVTGRSDVSATELQNALAEERRKAGGFESLIWIPPEVVPQSPRQKAFHEYLELNPEAQKNAEVWRRPFESFKGRIVEKLKKNDPPLPGPIKTIYLMCERRDYPSVRSVKDFLFNNGFEVFVLPSLDGQGPGAAFHENFLRSCDATLIYCGATDEDWVSYMILDMLNACRLRERGDFLCKALFLANPLADFQTHVAEILKHDGNSVESSLGPFIKCLQRNGATGGARP